MDIEFPNLPCNLLSLDAQDVVGTHTVNVGGDLYKRRLEKDGKEISVEQHVPASPIQAL